MMHARAAVLSAAIVMAPFSAWGADLVVCCQKAFCAPKCQAIGEIVAAFEGTGKGLDYRLMSSRNEVANTIAAVSMPRAYSLPVSVVTKPKCLRDTMIPTTRHSSITGQQLGYEKLKMLWID
jgi:hypothetical protein